MFFKREYYVWMAGVQVIKKLYSIFFSIIVLFHGYWQLTEQQGKGEDHLLIHSTTPNRSQTLTHSFTTLHVGSLSHFLIALLVFTRLLLDEIYHLIELPFWLINDVTLSVCLFTWWFDSSFFVIASWAGNPVDLNSHRLLPLYYKWNN